MTPSQVTMNFYRNSIFTDFGEKLQLMSKDVIEQFDLKISINTAGFDKINID